MEYFEDLSTCFGVFRDSVLVFLHEKETHGPEFKILGMMTSLFSHGLRNRECFAGEECRFLLSIESMLNCGDGDGAPHLIASSPDLREENTQSVVR